MKLQCKERAGLICHSIETKLLKLPVEKLFVWRWVSGHDNALFQSLWHIVIKSYRNVLVYLTVPGCPYVTASRIIEFMQFDVGQFYQSFLTHTIFGLSWMVIAHILHEDLTCNFCVCSSVTSYIFEWKTFWWKVGGKKWNLFNAQCSFS